MRDRVRRRLKTLLQRTLPGTRYRPIADAGKWLLYPERGLVALRQRWSLKRPLDYAGDPIWVFVDSTHEFDLRLRPCEKEPETVAWIEASVRAGDVVYDIGANIGAYALIAARATRGAARIFAFEPVFSTFAQLCRNVLANGCHEAIVPMPFGLSNQTGLQKFRFRTVLAGGAEHAGLADGAADGNLLEIPCYRLDDLVAGLGLPLPAHVKMDVDGFELEVLQGSGRVLNAPGLRSLMVEVSDEGRVREGVFELLRSHGFSVRAEHAHAGAGVTNCVFVRMSSKGGPV